MNTEQPLKIYHVILSKGFAGSERSTAESCNEQCKRHSVTLIIQRKHRKNNVSIVDHIDPRVKIEIVNANLFTRIQIKALIKRDEPDIIHSHLRRSTRIIAKINPPAATVSTLHIGINGPHFYNMDGLICNARWQIEDIPKDYKGLVHKANNSVSQHRRLEAQEIANLRNSLSISDQTYLIGAVGRYHPSKAWDTLINAFKQLKQSNIKLLFFGSGSQETDLKSLAGNDPRIQFVGYRPDIKDLYQIFDLCACTSRFEPLPRVILEAMDAGTPVIASNAGGCKELIEDYGGFMFDVDNVDDLRDTLDKCIKTKPGKHRPDLSAHHIENANRDIENFYRSIIAVKKH